MGLHGSLDITDSYHRYQSIKTTHKILLILIIVEWKSLFYHNLSVRKSVIFAECAWLLDVADWILGLFRLKQQAPQAVLGVFIMDWFNIHICWLVSCSSLWFHSRVTEDACWMLPVSVSAVFSLHVTDCVTSCASWENGHKLELSVQNHLLICA